MEHQQLCPNCSSNLDDTNNVLFTAESKIFKGHNVYMLCKNCGYVMVYNTDRDLIFNIDKYQNDEEVLKEIESLIKAVDSHYTLNLDEEVHHSCEGMCSSCQGCSNENTKEDLDMDLKEMEVAEEVKEEVVAEQPAFDPELFKDVLLLVDRTSGQANLCPMAELQFIQNLQNCVVYALEEVMLEPVVTFKIHKK